MSNEWEYKEEPLPNPSPARRGEKYLTHRSSLIAHRSLDHVPDLTVDGGANGVLH
jgi:hypothetical protein